jgi:HSP20 family protein
MTLVKNHNKSSIQRWNNPFDRLFRNDFMDLWNQDVTETIPSINITEEKNNYVVEMAAPGLKKEDFNIDVERGLITISCEKETETTSGDNEKGNNGNYTRREYNYSSFSRSFTLPENADGQKIKAKYTDGILRLEIAKNEESQKSKSQKIKVE